MKRLTLFALIGLLFMVSCTNDDMMNSSNTGSGRGGIRFRLKKSAYIGDINSRTESVSTGDYDKVFFYIADSEGDVMTTVHGKYNALTSEIYAEGLHEGDYNLLVLAIKGDETADRAEINEISSMDDEWLVFPSDLHKPLEAEYFYSCTPFTVRLVPAEGGSTEVISIDSEVTQGTKAARTKRRAGIPVGEAYIGRIVDALGSPIDGRGEIKASEYRPVEQEAPGIRDCFESVQEPLAYARRLVAAKSVRLRSENPDFSGDFYQFRRNRLKFRVVAGAVHELLVAVGPDPELRRADQAVQLREPPPLLPQGFDRTRRIAVTAVGGSEGGEAAAVAGEEAYRPFISPLPALGQPAELREEQAVPPFVADLRIGGGFHRRNDPRLAAQRGDERQMPALGVERRTLRQNRDRRIVNREGESFARRNQRAGVFHRCGQNAVSCESQLRIAVVGEPQRRLQREGKPRRAEAEPELSLLTPERFDFASVPGEAENRLSAAECEGGIRLIQRNCSAILHQFRHGVAPRSEKSVG